MYRRKRAKHSNAQSRFSFMWNLQGSGISHAMTASPESFFRPPWRVGDVVKDMLYGHIEKWTSLPCQNCSQGPPAEKTGRGFLLNHPSQSVKGLNWTELKHSLHNLTMVCAGWRRKRNRVLPRDFERLHISRATPQVRQPADHSTQ